MKKSLLVVSLCLGCNAISGIEEYQVAPVRVAATGVDGDAVRPEVFSEETKVDAGLDVVAETEMLDSSDVGIVDVIDTEVVADAGCPLHPHHLVFYGDYESCLPTGTLSDLSTYSEALIAEQIDRTIAASSPTPYVWGKTSTSVFCDGSSATPSTSGETCVARSFTNLAAADAGACLGSGCSGWFTWCRTGVVVGRVIAVSGFKTFCPTAGGPQWK